MIPARTWFAAAALAASVAVPALAQQAQPANPMGFFVTSASPGKGATWAACLAPIATARCWRPRPAPAPGRGTRI